MLNDTEAPTAPMEWAAPVHGDLVLVDRVRADSWEPLDAGEQDDSEATLVEGVLATVERGAGPSLLLKSSVEGSRTCLLSLDEGGFLVVTHLGGEGGPDVKVAARDVPADAFTDTGATITIGFVGAVLFDGGSTWEMASEQFVYAFAEPRKGDYAVSVADERETESGKRFRVIKLSLQA